jgi:hypothetical protein
VTSSAVILHKKSAFADGYVRVLSKSQNIQKTTAWTRVMTIVMEDRVLRGLYLWPKLGIDPRCANTG